MNTYLFCSSNPGINDENVNVLNVACDIPDGRLRLEKKVLQQSSSSKAGTNASAPSSTERVLDNRTPSTVEIQSRQYNFKTDSKTKSEWDGANQSTSLMKINSEDTEDEIMQFRASSSDSDGPLAEVPPSRLLGSFEQTIPVPPLNIKRLRMLPTIIEVASTSEESTTYVAFHEENPNLSSEDSFDFDEMYVRGSTNEESVEIMAVNVSVSGGNKVGVLLMHRVQVVKRGHLQ